MTEYEGVLVVDPQLDEEGVNRIRGFVEKAITDGNGEVGEWERWGRRKLAYKIKGKVEATYILLTFKGGEEIISELRKACGLAEEVLRCMFLKHSKL